MVIIIIIIIIIIVFLKWSTLLRDNYIKGSR
jgi:hypothetical protein